MKGKGSYYLSDYDRDTFIRIISNVADDQNCVTPMYAEILAYYLKKKRKRNLKAFVLLNTINCKDLALKYTETLPPSKSWLTHYISGTNIRLVSKRTIDLQRRTTCNVASIYFYFEMHSFLFNRHPKLILNMD